MTTPVYNTRTQESLQIFKHTMNEVIFIRRIFLALPRAVLDRPFPLYSNLFNFTFPPWMTGSTLLKARLIDDIKE